MASNTLYGNPHVFSYANHQAGRVMRAKEAPATTSVLMAAAKHPPPPLIVVNVGRSALAHAGVFRGIKTLFAILQMVMYRHCINNRYCPPAACKSIKNSMNIKEQMPLKSPLWRLGLLMWRHLWFTNVAPWLTLQTTNVSSPSHITTAIMHIATAIRHCSQRLPVLRVIVLQPSGRHIAAATKHSDCQFPHEPRVHVCTYLYTLI